jgi:hypothetical protein
MADPEHVPDRQMLAELEKQRLTSAQLRDKLAVKLGAFASLGSRAAGSAQRAATYVKSSSAQELMAEVDRLIRRRPGSSLLVALAAGYLIGKVLRARRPEGDYSWPTIRK